MADHPEQTFKLTYACKFRGGRPVVLLRFDFDAPVPWINVGIEFPEGTPNEYVAAQAAAFTCMPLNAQLMDQLQDVMKLVSNVTKTLDQGKNLIWNALVEAEVAKESTGGEKD